jgi:chromosome segregation ATPase
MEWLKELLTGVVDESKIDDVVKKFNAEFPKHAVPKDKYNETASKLSAAETQAKDLNEVVKGLQDKAKSAEDYQKQLNDAQAKIAEIQANADKQVKTLSKKTAIKDLLVKNQAHQDAIDLLTDAYTDVVELDDKGAIKEADKFLEKVKAEKGGLFKTVVKDGADKNPQNPPSDAARTANIARIMGIKPDPKP